MCRQGTRQKTKRLRNDVVGRKPLDLICGTDKYLRLMSGVSQAVPRGATRKLSIPPCLWPVLVSALTWAAIFVAVPPGKQDFPLGDDWAFSHSAIWFAHGQGIHYIKWASMPQLGQWLWSWPFLQLIPWPHVALRLSVIVLSWLGLAAFCDLLRLENVEPRLAGFAACVLALNPLFFVSAETYMTDVPALSFGLLALYCYSRAAVGKNPRWLLAAILCAVFAVITRQTMVAVPLAAAVPIVLNREMRQSQAWWLSVLVPLAACVYTAWWFSHRTDVDLMPASLFPTSLVYRPFVALHLAGLAVLPLLLLVGPQGSREALSGAFLVTLLAAGYCYSLGPGLPYGGWFPYSTGMLSLEGTYSPGLVVGHRDILLTTTVRIWLTVLGCAGGALILAALWDMIQARKLPNTLLVFTFLQFGFLLTLSSPPKDRYVEVLFPGALFLAATRCSLTGFRRFGGIAALAASGFIAAAFCHDCLAWNEVRWQLGRDAVVTKGIPPADIEGGFEWNGWYERNDPAWAPVPRRPIVKGDPASLALPFSRWLFPKVTGRYALAYSPPSNSIIVTSVPYSTWLPPAQKEFYLVRQKPAISEPVAK